MDNHYEGELFPPSLQKKIRSKFHYVDADPVHGSRLFFENAGGSLRLKSVTEIKEKLERLPDCPDRTHERAVYLKELRLKGIDDIKRVMLGTNEGSVVAALTASHAMFMIAGAIIENVPGTNVVTTELEHPSAYDAVKYYADKTSKEFRVVKINNATGRVDPDEVCRHVDENTCILSILHASNLSGAIMDIGEVVRQARKIKPGLHIISDSVQHIPHASVDVTELGVDGINFAPYKCFGSRGAGYAWVSPRVAALPHDELLEKPAGSWELGSCVPSNFAAISEIINHVCWIGGCFESSGDRRNLYLEGMRRIHMHERALLHRMLDGSPDAIGLRKINGVSVLMDMLDITCRDLIIGICIDGIGFMDLVAEYLRRGVTVCERVDTSIYTKRILKAYGLTGSIRISPIHCHNTEDIDKFLLITKDIAEKFSGNEVYTNPRLKR